jgi:hypothetical protein
MEGRVVNAKRTPLMHVIRAAFRIDGVAGEHGEASSPDGNTVGLAIDQTAVVAGAVKGIDRLARLTDATFPIMPGSEGPCGWLSEALGIDVLLVERRVGGFPDDRNATGPTVAATATLETVATWFGFSLEECRRRFRVNLEIGGCDAFWEDSLASPMRPEIGEAIDSSSAAFPADPYAVLPPPEPRLISIGEVRLRATNPCRRCVVPSRDSRTAAVTAYFRDAFEARRSRSIRSDVDASAWSHWYRLAVNTAVVAGGGIAVGDPVSG